MTPLIKTRGLAPAPENVPTQSIPDHDKKKEVKGVVRLRPTPTKEPLITWDEFLSQTSTSIYLGLIGFAFGVLYAWYAYILSPAPTHAPIPAIFRGNGVDVEEVNPKQEDLDRPRAF